MVQCCGCKKYVHGSCDPEADLSAYQTKKAAAPDYTYNCPVCKQYSSNRKGLLLKRNSVDDADQDSSFFGDDSLSGMDMDAFERVR